MSGGGTCILVYIGGRGIRGRQAKCVQALSPRLYASLAGMMVSPLPISTSQSAIAAQSHCRVATLYVPCKPNPPNILLLQVPLTFSV